MIDVSKMTQGDVTAVSDNGQKKNTRLLTKAEACHELGISLSTLDRRIASGEIEVRKEPRGRRHRVYVVMEGTLSEGEPNDSLIVLALAVALERILDLERKVTVIEEQLREEREHNSSTSRNQQRPWWRFWDSPK